MIETFHDIEGDLRLHCNWWRIYFTYIYGRYVGESKRWVKSYFRLFPIKLRQTIRS